jgi:hypothetical protein
MVKVRITRPSWWSGKQISFVREATPSQIREARRESKLRGRKSWKVSIIRAKRRKKR